MSAEREKLIEVMARAAFECEGGAASRGHRDWNRAGERNQSIWRAEAAAALDAALGAVDEETCPECGGKGALLIPEADDPRDVALRCSSCAGSGKVNPRWLIPRYEQVGAIAPSGKFIAEDFIGQAVPVFRKVFPVLQTREEPT